MTDSGLLFQEISFAAHSTGRMQWDGAVMESGV